MLTILPYLLQGYGRSKCTLLLCPKFGERFRESKGSPLLGDSKMKSKFKFRVFENKEPKCPTPFKQSKDVFELVSTWINADREVFIIFFLNSKNFIIDHEIHSIGDVDASAVYPRQVFRSALAQNCTSVIFAHNHPSGDCEPSRGDDNITRQLVFAGEMLGIDVLDHVIVGKNSYYSYCDKERIEDIKLEAKRVFNA
jgi:DNA repair protein RadC